MDLSWAGKTGSMIIWTHANLILLRLLGLAAGRCAGGSRRIPLSPRRSRMTCTIRHPKARAASMNSSRAPARSGRMPTSESWRPPPSREEPTTGTDGGLHGFKTLLPDLRPHHHETGELNLNHPIGARRSIPLRCCASTTKCGAACLDGSYFSSNRPAGEDKPFIRNAISGDKSVHEPIVRRPAHPRRLVGGTHHRPAHAKPQARRFMSYVILPSWCCNPAALSQISSRGLGS
jgi:hypothetical protein